jgi:hypothetical protein
MAIRLKRRIEPITFAFWFRLVRLGIDGAIAGTAAAVF